MASTHVLFRNEAKSRTDEDLYVSVYLQFGASKLAKKYIHSDSVVELPCEFVWYDIFVYDGDDCLAKKIGVYGDSSWRLINSGNAYRIVK